MKHGAKQLSYVVLTANRREQIQVSTIEEAQRAKADMERRHGRTVLILPMKKEVVL